MPTTIRTTLDRIAANATIPNVIAAAATVDVPPRAFELSRLLAFVGTHVRGRAGEPNGRQRLALGRIQRFAETNGTIRFPGCQRTLIATELVARVLAPVYINQQNRSLCGPNSLIIDVATRRPDDYARMVIELAESSETRLNRLVVTAGRRLLWHTWARNDIAQADYIMLGSLRSSSNIFGYGLGNLDTDEPVAGATRAKTLCDWLEAAGYINVRDETITQAMAAGSQHAYFGLGSNRTNNLTGKAANLQRAINQLGAGHRIIAFTSVELAREVMRGNLVNPETRCGFGAFFKPVSRHYMLVDALAASAVNVNMTAYTWGQRIVSVPIPVATFYDHYFGHVSAQPV